jgi:hypothetical protein
MAEVVDTPRVIFPEWFDDRAEFETPEKGWLDHVQVQLPDGSRYRVFFIDPVRLGQDLAEYQKLGTPFFAEPGLIVLCDVTRKAIHHAVEGLWRRGYFSQLKPVDGADADSGHG